MPKRSSYELRNRILGSVRERPVSYAKIERNVDTNHYSVKAHCKELEEDGFVTIEKIPKHSSNGRVSFLISITSRGIEKLKKKEK